ncbi:MAG: D-aminoacylase [Vicinamibacterales bacterium]
MRRAFQFSISPAATTPALLTGVATCLVAAWIGENVAGQPPPSTVIIGARVADGTGGPLTRQNVRIVGDSIAAVGSFEAQSADAVVRAEGLVVAPGFIDVHNHSSEGLLEKDSLATSQISQGITTVVLGPDGSSPWPIKDYFDTLRERPVTLNTLMTVGHATVRRRVMGDDYKRAATADEVVRMKALVQQGFEDGAVGLSSGLEYEVGGYATTDEVVELATVAAKYGGFYTSHIRDEADKAFDAMRELIEIGERAHLPVQNTHIKLGTVGVWHKAPEAVKLVADARARGLDVTADCYPYDAWHSTITVLVPNKQYADRTSVDRGLADVGGAENVTITECKAHPDFEGQTLAALAQAKHTTAADIFIQVVKDGGAGVIAKSMVDDDIELFYKQSWVMVGSDGGIGMRHPRAAGTFPRVLGRFVRDRKWLTLENAVRKMTSLPAERLKMTDRGLVRAGMKADLVLFNPDTIVDRSTFAEPDLVATGVEKVWVNGVPVWSNGQATGARPGRPLPRSVAGPTRAR